MDGTILSPIIATLPRGHRLDRQLGVVYDTPPSSADDLTRVEGIRTRESVLLNQMGIYTFGQIALWRHREILSIASELQVPIARIVDERWSEQARSLCAPAEKSVGDRPASYLRIVSMLTCALLLGCLTVYMLGRHQHAPITGVLCADITTVVVPSPSRLTKFQVRVGDEVFSGQPLFTLEKLEHLSLLEAQQQLINDLEIDRRRLEAATELELTWRTRDLDRQLFSIRREISSRMQRLDSKWPQTADAIGVDTNEVAASPKSPGASADTEAPSQRSGILFFSNANNESTSASPRNILQPVPQRTAMISATAISSSTPGSESIDEELESLQSEQQRLESMRSALPEMVKDAMGLKSLKARCLEETSRLETMKSASRESHVKAPVYGVVGQIRCDAGDDVAAGAPVLRILHTDRRYIVASLPTSRVHEMDLGVEVELIFPGNELFRGQVIDVPVMADETGASGNSQTSVRIEPVGRLWPMIPIGSQIDVISLK